MTDGDLEVKAIFAPIPEDDYSVDFRPEPPIGGDVPEDIDKVITGSTVTLAVKVTVARVSAVPRLVSMVLD
jgi:hypothetical protein